MQNTGYEKPRSPNATEPPEHILNQGRWVKSYLNSIKCKWHNQSFANAAKTNSIGFIGSILIKLNVKDGEYRWVWKYDSLEEPGGDSQYKSQKVNFILQQRLTYPY